MYSFHLSKLLASRGWLILLWATLVFCSLSFRPLIPVDETRYASVAWEMWLRDDFLVPHLNGETYSHKPPLLFWLIQLSWWLFGVNDWTTRLISPLFGLASLFLTERIAGLLWPDDKQTGEITPYILLGGYVWAVFGTLTMFDIMLAFFVLLGILAILQLARNGARLQHCAILAVAIGGGVLTKGPVIVLHLLPVALLAPWWLSGEVREKIPLARWYGMTLLAVLGGASIALAWAIPAGMAGGEVYRKAIFLGQTSGRVVDSFAHKLPWWWYLQLLPVFTLPWAFSKALWSGVARLDWRDSGIRFCLAWALPVFLAFSIVSGKRIHYLIPLLPALALFIARAMAGCEKSYGTHYKLYMAILGGLGLLLMILTLLNTRYLWLDDFIALSPLWGALVAIVGFALWLFKFGDETGQSVKLVTSASVLVILALAAGYFSIQGNRYDTVPTAQKIAELQADGHNVAMLINKYHGQFQFTGRLVHTIQIIQSPEEILNHASIHPEDYLVVMYKKLAEGQENLFVFRHPLKSQTVGIIKERSLLSHPELVKNFIP